jgi:hypothetical protein
MSENRRQVLEMLAAGQVTADEAERLIAALENRSATPEGARSEPGGGAPPKYLRVLVDVDDEKEGPIKVNARVPLQLLRAGVRLASLVPAVAQERISDELHKQGLALDISQIKPENLEELIDQLRDLTVDVDQRNDNLKVRVFCE